MRYIAIYDGNEVYGPGSLNTIVAEITGNEREVDDCYFFEAKEIQVKVTMNVEVTV